MILWKYAKVVATGAWVLDQSGKAPPRRLTPIPSGRTTSHSGRPRTMYRSMAGLWTAINQPVAGAKNPSVYLDR